ncbi:solute carrier family 26 member 6-like protein [Leptotrombidium deliense]|uniref:Solute carrier family 26 member 6-like protein n=1 Tax=Leptotrombidium deliense TaxID=299467 RepID=A0A443S715_9ACAR|nr:solute carrier family 26 member 6-like protein [Leptotrombidium deliense]
MQQKVENSEEIINHNNNEINMNPSGEVDGNATVRINRSVYNLPDFDKAFEAIKSQKKSVCESAAKWMKPSCALHEIKWKLNSILPITSWLVNYKFKRDLLADVIVGITVAIFQVPQSITLFIVYFLLQNRSMGYCLIAHVPPVHGLYTAFFPALVYSFLGTSRHSAVGAFAIVSGVMTGNLVTEVMEQNGVSLKEIEERMSGSVTRTDNLNSDTQTMNPMSFEASLTTSEIATAACLWIGIYMLAFGVFRLGFISIYLSEQLISGFGTAASLYVFTSQLRYLFGVHLPYNSGMFAIIRSYIDLVKDYQNVNLVTTGISVICCSVLLFFKSYVNEKMKNAGYKIPIPIELFVVIGGTLASNLLDLNGNYNVQIVGEIKKGLPMPEIPRMEVMKQTWIQSISLATVGFTITLTVGKLYGGKHGYEVSANQELVALGTTNIVASFFGCLPSAASLPRSAVQEQAGGRTQMASFVNCATMLIVLFYLAPLLQKLPNCVLASVIAVALKSLLGQVKEFNRYRKVSKLDASIWMVSFMGVLVLDVDFGLYFAVVFSLLVLIYKSSRPKSYILGSINNSDVYVPVKKYVSAIEIPGIKIYQFCGPLHFANVEFFKRDILKRTQYLNRNKIIAGILAETESRRIENITYDNPAFNMEIGDHNGSEISYKNIYTHLIIDCSMISYCDAAGIQMLRKIIQIYQNCDVNVYLAACISHVIRILEKDSFFNQLSKDRVFISIHDAVLKIVNEQQKWCENCFDCKDTESHICNTNRRQSHSISADSNN